MQANPHIERLGCEGEGKEVPEAADFTLSRKAASETVGAIFSMSPNTGMFIIFAIFTALATIIDTSSCGDVTTMIPSRGRDWKTVRGTSPVPGGIS